MPGDDAGVAVGAAVVRGRGGGVLRPRDVIVDEWHELLSTKRGTQTELGLARLRTFNPGVQTWGLSATLGNLEEAKDCLLGVDPATGAAREGCRLAGPEDAGFELTTLLPPGGDGVANRFPWSGHLGIVLLDAVLDALEPAASTLLFTNTRSQAEIWYARICEARPEWLGKVALHHGSIDRDTRNAVEQMLRTGELKVCVCTSSLDLGVDFSPVEQVIQVASPKGVARMLQRAGRSGHQPGVRSRASSASRRTRWRCWISRPPATPGTAGRSRAASRSTGRWTWRCSTW